MRVAAFTPPRFRAVALALAFLPAVASAQSLSFSPLAWTNPFDPPDQLPAWSSAPRPALTDSVRALGDVHYVVLDVVLDPKGRLLGTQRYASTPALERLVDENSGLFRFSPGRRAGKGVNAAVTTALIFHPAGPAAEGPDAAPRLLEAAPVRLKWPRGRKPTDRIPDEVVWTEVTVAADGTVAGIKGAPEAHAAEISIAAKNWRFAPARRGGEPAEATLKVPFVLTWPNVPAGGKATTPKVVFQKRPDYPFLMRASGQRGEVLVDFVVDIEGRVRNAFVARSSNPSFDDAAIEAVHQWRFEPGKVGDRPVPTHMQVPIIFVLDEVFNGGSDGLEVVRKADLSKLPEALRYDVPPKITGIVRAVYPYEALRAGRKGHAIVTYIVGPSGRVAQATVAEASAPEFGAALVAAIEHFTFVPAVKGGKPSPSIASFRQEFSSDPALQMVSDDDVRLVELEKKRPEKIVSSTQLDRPVTPRSRRPPRFPLNGGEPAAGDNVALIEFLIDEQGRARLPRVVSAPNESFGEAGVVSVAGWRFEPPTVGGRPVVTRIRVPIAFTVAEGPGNR